MQLMPPLPTKPKSVPAAVLQGLITALLTVVLLNGVLLAVCSVVRLVQAHSLQQGGTKWSAGMRSGNSSALQQSTAPTYGAFSRPATTWQCVAEFLGLSPRRYSDSELSAWHRLAALPAVRLPAHKAQRGAFDHLCNCTAAQQQSQHTAVATLLADDTYAAGAVTLAYSLRLHGSPLPLLLLEPETSSMAPAVRRLLQRAGWRVVTLPEIPAPWGTPTKYASTLNKLSLWRLQQYDAIMYFDADGLLLRSPQLCVDAFQLDLQQCLQQDRTAARRQLLCRRNVACGCKGRMGAVKDLRNAGRTFNSGMMLLQPDQAMFAAMMARLPTERYNQGVGEQGFLNNVFVRRWARLPGGCNLLTASATRDARTFAREFPDVSFLHYAGRTPRVMGGGIELNVTTGAMAGITGGAQAQPVDSLWSQAWLQAARLLELPQIDDGNDG